MGKGGMFRGHEVMKQVLSTLPTFKNIQWTVLHARRQAKSWGYNEWLHPVYPGLTPSHFLGKMSWCVRVQNVVIFQTFGQAYEILGLTPIG